MSDKPIVWWLEGPPGVDGKPNQWSLMVRRRSKSKCAATVWRNVINGRGTWHTWDHNGQGGENDVEETIERAKIEAAASAIAQGFI
jgi:hypothetical protein